MRRNVRWILSVVSSGLLMVAPLVAMARTVIGVPEGTWRYAVHHPRPPDFMQEWTFQAGTFRVTGYPPLSQTGSYRLIGGTGGRLTVELYDQHGDWGTEHRTITIQPASDGRSMMIDGQGPFEFVPADAAGKGIK